MSSSTIKLFGSLFKTLRIKAGIGSLKEFGDLFANHGYFYEESMFSHWQKGRKIPKQRQILLTILLIFREKDSNLSVDVCNTFLESAGQGYLTESERKRLNIVSSVSSFYFALPPQLSYFNAREREIEEILKAIDKYKIIQIYGQAGIGKTALAIEIAYRCASLFSDGILWYRIDTQDIVSILNHIAQVYNDNVDDVQDIALKNSIIRSLLKDKKILIILDNAEDVALKNLYSLLTIGKNVRYIITTRYVYLPIDQASYQIKLKGFNQNNVKKIYQKIVHLQPPPYFINICKKYDFLPLVVTSLAKRIGYLKANNITYKLDNLVETTNLFVYEDKNLYDFLNKTIKMLSAKEPKVWISTASFNGTDFSEEALRFINDLSRKESYEILEKLFNLSLVEKSLKDRWRIHPIVKKYLSSFISERHFSRLTGYYTSFFKRDEDGYTKTYPKIEIEFDNIRNLLDYFLKNDFLDKSFQIWEFLSIYLWARGYWCMFKDFGERLLALAQKKQQTVIEATISIRDLSWLYIWQGELLKAYKLLKNQELQNAVRDNLYLVGLTYERLGFILGKHRLLRKALMHLHDGRKVFEKTQNMCNIAKIFMYIGNSHETIGDFPKALFWYQKALFLASKHNYFETKSISYYYIGEVYKKRKKFTLAKKYFMTALSIDNEMKRKAGIGWNKHSLAEIARDEGKMILASKLHREAHTAFSLVGINPLLH